MTPTRASWSSPSCSRSLTNPVFSFVSGAVRDRRAERFGQSGGIGAAHFDFRGSVPAGAVPQRRGQSEDEVFFHRHARLEVRGLHLEHSPFAVGFRVEPAHQRAAVQYREGVVSVPAFGRRGVYLDPVFEAE